MELSEYIQKDMVDFLDMIVRAAIEHDKRSEQEINALLENTTMNDSQRREMTAFFGPGAGTNPVAASAGIQTNVQAVQGSAPAQPIIIQQPIIQQGTPQQPTQQQIQAHVADDLPTKSINQGQVPSLEPTPEGMKQAQQSQSPQASTKTSLPQAGLQQPIQHPVHQPLEPNHPKHQEHAQQAHRKGPSLPTPGLVHDEVEKKTTSQLLHHRQQQRRVASQDLPFHKGDTSSSFGADRTSMTSDFDSGSIERRTKRSELTQIAHYHEKIDAIKKLIKEKRYVKAFDLQGELKEEAMRIQYHPIHRRKMMDILIKLETEILDKEQLLKPIKIPEDHPDYSSKKERKKKPEVYRVSVRKKQQIVEAQRVTGANVYKAGRKTQQQVENEQNLHPRFSRVHNDKYRAALHALHQENYGTAEKLFLQLIKERPNNKGLRMRYQQALLGAHHGR